MSTKTMLLPFPKEASRKEFDTPFYRYFLDAQRAGREVYIGEEIAMVVYEKDRTIGFQASDKYEGCRIFSAVFLSFDQMDDDTRKTLEKIRKPSNRNGVNDDLTGILSHFYDMLGRWYDGFAPQEELGIAYDYRNQLEFDFSPQLRLFEP